MFRHESSEAIFDLKNLPLCSTDKTPMIIPNAYNYDIHLNNNQEKEILSELNTQRSFQQQYLNCWFKNILKNSIITQIALMT